MGSLAAEVTTKEPIVTTPIGTTTARAEQAQNQRAKRRERMNKTVLGQSGGAVDANIGKKTLLGE